MKQKILSIIERWKKKSLSGLSSELICKARALEEIIELLKRSETLWHGPNEYPDEEKGWIGTILVVTKDKRLLNDVFYNPDKRMFLTFNLETNEEGIMDHKERYIERSEIHSWAFLTDFIKEGT